MRVLAVNVRAGGITAKIDALAARALDWHADVYVFSEFRDTAAGARIRSSMERGGLPHQAYSQGHRGNGVLVAARSPFDPVFNPAGLDDESYPHGMIECIFRGLHLFGVYLPGQDRKRPHLEYLVRIARIMNENSVPALAIGDFNSGRNETDIEVNASKMKLADEFSTAGLYARLEQYWDEAWLLRHPDVREYSWYPRMGPVHRRNGWRLDKAFVSRALLPRLRDAQYDHGFRLEALTDHSALVVDLDEGAA